jgi:hypothetical protein
MVGVLGIALVWALLTRSYVAYLADVDPERALAIRQVPDAALNAIERAMAKLRKEGEMRPPAPADKLQPDANAERLRGLAGLAAKASRPEGEQVAGSRTPGEELLYQRVRDALRADPLSARGLRLLAQLSEQHEPREEVANLMRMAVARSLHETRALYWLMVTSANAGIYTDAIGYADAILRTQSRLSGTAFQVFARATETPEGTGEVRRLVLANPPWRASFFATFSRLVTDARVPLQLLLDLRGTQHPPTVPEIASYMAVLIENRLFELAYYAWLQFLPPGQLAMVASPFNGSFELKPSGLPFDWIITSGTGVTAEVVSKPGTAGQKALLVEFGTGRLEFAGVSQLLLMPPGGYRFKAMHQGQVTGRRGLVWQVACIGGKELGRSAMIIGTAAAWTPIDFPFTVPDAGCPAQHVRLVHDARSASEQLATGKSFHDDVRIERIEAR